MNTLQSDKRHSRDYNAQLEYLDDRIVPSTLQPDLTVAELATAHASVNTAQQTEESATAESKIEIRRENRMARIAERQEKAVERREKAAELREARLEKIAARHQVSSAVVAGTQVGHLTVINFGSSSSGSGQSANGLSSFGAGTGTGGNIAPTTPVTIAAVTPTAVTTPVSTTSASATTPLPANVSALLDTVYEEFQNGTLPTTTQPGQVEIQGNNVGIQIQSSTSDFASMVATAESLGLQVTTSSDSNDVVVGFLPIANLPAIAQLAGSPSITPIFAPTLR